jgi:hypothetical protein
MQVLSFQIRYFCPIHRRHRRDRRSTSGRWDRSQKFQPRRRWLVRFRNIGLPLRRHPQILRTVRPTRYETDQVRNHSTLGRMESSKRQRSVVRRLQYCFKWSKSVFYERRPSGTDYSISVQGMLPVSVTFSDSVTVVYVDSYGADHRSEPWMYLAARRKRFARKISELDHTLSSILNDVYRLNVYMSRLHVCE